MKRLLALDTATEACSAALLVDGTPVERYEVCPREHARRLLPMVSTLLDEAGLGLSDLDAVAFGRGPGSFTGLRIAAGMAQGLAFAADLPVVPVSSLAALAQQVADTGRQRALAAIDARMGEVYWGAFVAGDDGLVAAVGEELVCPPDAVPLPDGGGWAGIGTGWGSYGDVLGSRLDGLVDAREPDAFPRAAAVARLAARALAIGAAVPASQALPVYLRDRVADKAPRQR